MPVGLAGAAGEPTCGARVVPPLPVVDAAVSARYRWDECGRIAPGKRSYQALYANDGSILTSDEDSAVRGYVSGSSTPAATLIDASEGAGGLVLANDGALLLATNLSGAHVYRSRVEGELISAQSGMLEEQLAIDMASEGCDGSATFSADSKLIVAAGAGRLCAWQTADGKLVSSIPLPEATSAFRTVVGAEAGATTLSVLRDNQLLRYTLAGELAQQRDLPGITRGDIPLDLALSADARTVVLLVRGAARVSLLAFDVASGVTRWQVDAATPVYSQLAASRDGYVLASGMGVYRIEDGQLVGGDAPSYTNARPALGLGGLQKLVPGDQIAEWHEPTQQLLRLYGAHNRGIVALDISADGRYLASHSGWAIVWQLADVFSESVPQYSGSAPDSSWNVGIAPDGGALVASGDNVAFFERGGAHQGAGQPPPNAGFGCLSADWAFSPDGCRVAGTHYGPEVVVEDARDFTPVIALPTSNCSGGVAFSPDGRYLLTASLELFDTATWRTQWSIPLAPAPTGEGGRRAERAVQFSPDGTEVVITQPSDNVDSSFENALYRSVRHDARTGVTIADVPELTGDRVSYSPEQHWLVSRDRALHLPSGTTFGLPASSRVALFMPQGDIVAGEMDGSLVRYCRSSR